MDTIKKKKIKKALHQNVWEWFQEQRANPDATKSELSQQTLQSAWAKEMRELPEQERLALLKAAFIEDPPKHPNDLKVFGIYSKRRPDPIRAFLYGLHCIENRGILEGLFTAAYLVGPDAGWIKEAVEPLGPFRVIDLLFDLPQPPEHLAVILYDFERYLLRRVAPEKRDQITQYYLSRKTEAFRQHLFINTPGEEEMAKWTAARLASGLLEQAS